MSTLSSPVPIMAIASIVASAWASGAGAAISFFTITPILRSSAPREVMLEQWHIAFNLGKAFMPPFAAAIAASYTAVAYTCFTRSLEWRGFAAAGALTIGIVPFTILFILETVGELEGMIARGRQTALKDDEDSEKVRTALGRWSRLNLARAVLPLAGTGSAVWNLLSV
ncbi:hypothetical protein BKA67DRAFT_531752 [Truncatella angustata]|uniref:DUF1772-domain-containing protein n=1 Tax=Truncatella angustata TaxID=152316 RepID=A0A9P8UQY2_9PEZI|nr:uncharacterized protein BKA67DRAFT_531752 [Truncatella angustata]KAH6656482.1 hypothetical protein BKA67DRAFT_531752 [Truncatella angustata]